MTHDRWRQWLRSLPTVDTVIALSTEHYPIGPVDAELVRSFINDVYRVKAAEGSYALKIYGADRFNVDEVRWEQHLVRHLVDHGLPVARTVDLCSGDCVGTLDAPEGVRPFALTRWAPGTKPRPPWTDDLYRRFGILLARLPKRRTRSTVILIRRWLRSAPAPGADDFARRSAT